MSRTKWLPVSPESRRRCLICDRAANKGLSLRGQLICGPCEKKIVTLHVSERRYDMYLRGVKRLWAGDGAREEIPH